MGARQVRRLSGLLLNRRLDFKSDGIIFPREKLSRTQIFNLLLGRMEARLRLTRPLSYPTGLELEPTLACQLDCPLCPREGVAQKPGRPMQWAGYEKLMQEVGPYLLATALWRFGEPFLHPRLIEMVAMAHRYNILTLLSTNAQFDPQVVDLTGLFEAGLDHLIISTDGATPETYSYFRKGGNLEKLKDFTKTAAKIKRKLKLHNPVITVRAIATRTNEAEIEEIASLARAVGADVFTLKSLYLTGHADPAHRDLPRNYELRSLQYRGTQGAAEYRRLPYLCRKPWNWPTVCHDGTLLMCECDEGHERILGNVFADRSFRFLWRGRPAQDFRRSFPNDVPFCQNCRFKVDDNTLMARALNGSGQSD
ncbi:MAG: radical SAM/SPASM domain-containing protein [Acidobacteria bacterium]|nr:MAG: radical SAM/SPASM domain-containing protein [Acidobacteriota bacterium]